MDTLPFDTVGHAAWTVYSGTASSQTLPGIAAVRHVRFKRQVRLRAMQIFPHILRWAPPGYGQPAHVQVARQNPDGAWQVIVERDLPCFESGSESPHNVALDDVETDHLRLVCDLEHETPPAHGQVWANPHVVPFSIFDHLEFCGEPVEAGSSEAARLEANAREPLYNPPLKRGAINPQAPPGMEVVAEPHQISFRSPSFAVGFSLRRPLLIHFGLDPTGQHLAMTNLLATDRVCQRNGDRLEETGPLLRSVSGDAFAPVWTGEVEVAGARVLYKDLHAVAGLSFDIAFTVRPDGMCLDWTCRCERPLAALECEWWRFMWEGKVCVTGTWGIPELAAGRTGTIAAPVRWCAPGFGTALVRYVAGEPVVMQNDSARLPALGWVGLCPPAERDEWGALTLRQGESHGALDVQVEAVWPQLAEGVDKAALPPGLIRNWHSTFGFRPEYGGVSNNAMSVNCHVSQGPPVDMAAYTAPVSGGPHPIELCRHTITLALQGGPGYGDNRELYMDSDPNLIAAAGRLHQVAPDTRWLAAIWPFLRQAVDNVLGIIDENGLMCCRELTGNRGSNRWSSNAWDVVSFGHYDAYSNAWGYRALRSAAAMARDAGDAEMAERCRTAADTLRERYFPCFYNPATGWLGGWRSADGELHDYCFTFVNGIALCYGLVPEDKARAVIEAIEAKRQARGLDYLHYGLAANLDPLPPDEVPAEQAGLRADGWDMFGIYINGSLTPVFAQFYLRALSQYGFRDTADKMCDHLEASLEVNRFTGGVGTGLEFFTWEGRPCGYEGTLVGCFPVLFAMALHRGWVQPLEPEWWPG